MTQPIIEDRRTVIIRRTVILLIVLACIAGLVLAVQHTRRGDEQIDLTGGNSVVELLTPPNASTLVNQQAQVGIDLTTPYSANLIVDGTLIPEDQLVRRPELNAVYFTPGPGKVLERLPGGRNTVQALVFRVDGTPGDLPAVTWTFNVS